MSFVATACQTSRIEPMIIFRYLCKEVLGSLLATTLVFLIILIMNQFVHYLNNAASGQITMTAVMKVMALQVPLLLGFLLPLGLFIGIIMAFGRLYVDSEMTVMTSCGVSRMQLIAMALIFATGVVVVVAVLMLWAEPKVQWYRNQILQQAITNASLDKMLPGRFESVGKGDWTFYAAGVGEHKHSMSNVFMANRIAATGDKPERWDVVRADGAHEHIDPKTKQNFLVFERGYRAIGTPGKNDYQLAQFKRYGIRLGQGEAASANNVKYFSTSHLRRIQYTDPNAAAELQWRIAMPISVWLFALLAVPLSYTKPRHGRYVQLVPAILLYIIYADLMFVGRAWIQQGAVSPVLGLWWLHAAMLIVAVLIAGRYVFGHKRWLPRWLRVSG